MPIYGLPLTGCVYVEADSPESALATAKQWADIVFKNSCGDKSEAVPDDIGFIILTPNDSNIKDVTDFVTELHQEAAADE